MIIAPSLLAADYGRLMSETLRIKRSRAEWVHLDIMDGHFVPNISFGPGFAKRLRPLTTQLFDVHLMCSKPTVLLEPFVKAGADRLTVHVELEDQISGLLWKIRSMDKKVGLAVNPPTPIAAAKPFLDQIDLLLIMTVNPGFGGQSFMEEMIPKIQQAREWRAESSLSYHIEVDGGIDFDTAPECARAGADAFVSGTGLLKHRNLPRAVSKMRRLVNDAARVTDSDRPTRGRKLAARKAG